MWPIMEKILIFSPRYKKHTHIAKFTLTSIAIACTIARLAMKNQVTTRAHTLAITMGLKSFVILAYEVFTERKPSLARWKSLKAYWILNFVETATWGMVLGLVAQVNMAICTGPGCALSWIVAVIALVVMGLSLYAFLVTFREDLEARSAKKYSGFVQPQQHQYSRPSPESPAKEVRVSEQHLQPYSSYPRTYRAEQQQQQYQPYSPKHNDRTHGQYSHSQV